MGRTEAPSLRPELMDDPALPLEQTERALRDIDRVHRWVGNRALWRRLMPALVAGGGRGRVLDVGTGAGSVAAQALERARRRGLEVVAIGVDRKLSHLVLGRHRAREPLRVVGDARALPFADGAVTASFSTLFQHHFELEEGRRVMDEMRRVSRRSAVVVDIRHSRLGSLLGRLVLALLGVGPVARYDGRLSLEQGWRLADARRAAPPGSIRSLARCWPFRWALELDPAARCSEDPVPQAARGVLGAGSPREEPADRC